MKTKHKILLAKTAYHAIHAMRAAVGRSDVAVFEREGLNYELDLSQGIDFSIFLLGSFERETKKALRELVKPGDMVLDIGANVGAHALPLAALVGPKGRVIACEPTDFAFRKLNRNLELNPDLTGRVMPIQCFLTGSSHASVPDSIYSGWPLKGGENLHPKHLGSEETTAKATCRSVDEVVRTANLPRVDLIKMDVDGFECDVLSGAIEVMARDKPKFVMEISPYVLAERGGSLKLFLSYFKGSDYKFFDEKTSEPIPLDESELNAIIGDGASKNVIARVS